MLATHYDVLEVARDASDVVIRAAYKSLAQKYHPDRYDGPSPDAEQRTKLLNEAYSVLSDPVRREQYNKSIAVQERSDASSNSANVRRKMSARPFPTVAMAMIVIAGIVAGILYYKIRPADAKEAVSAATGTAKIQVTKTTPPPATAAARPYSHTMQDLREKCKPPQCRIVQ